ncbi:prolyl oligopeptidase family serine peptidase [Gracilibacillus salitolerans]|uniref:Prolyl oligopeptidase family serine peptidase n=1 Tax=Gracilibacillus salitolerans TaxID=2663022 RepID=A0A5Q2TN95_9BACI|nr:alpha/beta fold hydrolase [Gracilibacillus salitolerans]QGH35641.1 prolyl oligopeptidase family serine peptidase [Gracilibacillus salitolerans]
MIEISKEYWNDIPLLHVVDQEKKDQALPTLTYIHGFTSAKEHNLPLAYLLAEKGYRVLLPDSILHGDRETDISHAEKEIRFFDIVKQNLDDVESIYQELIAKQLLEGNRFGLAGTSMGGITTAAALTQFSWIKTAGVLMGSPKITAYAEQLIGYMKAQQKELPIPDDQLILLIDELKEMDLSLQMEKLFGRSLFFWHGEDDMVVPFDHAYSFYEEAIDHYKNPENIRFLKEIGRGHKVSRFAILEFVKWLEYQL